MAQDFPEGAPNFSSWEHPITGAKYYWDQNKQSWMKGANAGTQVYTGPNPPSDYNQMPFVPNDGDMWWDTHMLELRVWHAPMGPASKDPGRWVSSTNPQMALNDPNRNSIIGEILLTEQPPSMVLEDEETTWEVERVVKDDSEKYVQYEWIVNPPSMISNGVETPVVIVGKNQKRAKITWPTGTAYVDPNTGEKFKYVVRCQVKPQEGQEDRFIEKWQYSDSVVIYPVTTPQAPLDYAVLSNYTDTNSSIENLGIAPGTLDVTRDAADNSIHTIATHPPQIFIDLGTNVDYPDNHTIFSSVPADQYNGSQSVSSAYVTGLEMTDGLYLNGYLIEAEELTDAAGGDATVYFWKANETDKGGTLIIEQ